MEGKQELYTTQAAAEQLELSDSHMRNMIRTGIARPQQRIGNSWVFTAEEIERLRHRKRTRGPKKKNANSL